MVVTWRRRAKFAAVVVEVVVAVAVVAVAVVDLSCVVAVLQLDPGWRRIEQQQREGSPTSGLLCPRLKVYEVIL